MGRLENKVAIVTGGAKGIGYVTCNTFSREGASVVIVDMDKEAAEKAAQEINDKGGKALAVAANLTVAEEREAIFAKAVEKFGKVDILINNAGIAWFGLLTDMTDNDWDKILATNLSSVFYCSRAAIPYMVSKKCGKILNISSMWGTVGASCEVAYSATKSGIHGLTRALAKELAPSNIQVNAIACGVIDTEMNGRLNEEERQDLMDEIPSGRFADPEEVAELALKLTDTPAYMTGQIIGIDGGFI